MGKHRLVPHPDHPPGSVETVEVSVWSGSHLMLTYAVRPAASVVLQDRGFERADHLWRSTCFEMFAQAPGEPAYREFNFAPPGAWNAYSFTGWRKGMAPMELAEPPHLVDCRADDRRDLLPGKYELDVLLGPGELRLPAPARMSLTTIVEERDGTMSYWALAHSPGPPDFHHSACFAAMLPPIGAE